MSEEIRADESLCISYRKDSEKIRKIMTTSMNVINSMLPSYMKAEVEGDEEISSSEVLRALVDLENTWIHQDGSQSESSDIVDIKIINRLCKVISTHITLKYRFEVSY